MKNQLDDSLIRELRMYFCNEAEELLANCEEALLNYENTPKPEHIDIIKRALHCLKGSAQAVSFGKFGTVMHELESALSSELGKQLTSVILQVIDDLRDSLKLYRSGMETEAFNAIETRIKSIKMAG